MVELGKIYSADFINALTFFYILTLDRLFCYLLR